MLKNADRAFRQREIVGAVDVPKGSVGPTLARLEAHGVVDHRGEYWSVADADHAVASAGALGAASADDRDGGFSDEEVAAWSETAVDPPESGDGRER
ncbi:MarR family transcriptional regulator [Halosimplex aquaticum]